MVLYSIVHNNFQKKKKRIEKISHELTQVDFNLFPEHENIIFIFISNKRLNNRDY